MWFIARYGAWGAFGVLLGIGVVFWLGDGDIRPEAVVIILLVCCLLIIVLRGLVVWIAGFWARR